MEEHVKQFLNKYRYLAIECEHIHGIPAELILCVAALESGWESNILAKEARNLFNIKSKSKFDMIYEKVSEEYNSKKKKYERVSCKFRSYRSVEDSFRDFCYRLNYNDFYKEHIKYNTIIDKIKHIDKNYSTHKKMIWGNKVLDIFKRYDWSFLRK
jgi:flagellum-specific peptidoglycan hydrolase FlgJ